MSWYDEYITRTPGVQGGEPVVAGTRTPVRSIVVLYDIHRFDRSKVRASLPHLKLEQIDAALDYYRDHKAEIDAIIRDQRQALQELSAAT